MHHELLRKIIFKIVYYMTIRFNSMDRITVVWLVTSGDYRFQGIFSIEAFLSPNINMDRSPTESDYD